MSSGPEEAAAMEPPAIHALPPGEESMKPERTPPERIGRYELCFELAAGGMATVYLARAHGASGFEKLVALKRIHPHLAKEQKYIEMFLDEAKIASRISHPNVCSVFDFGQVDGEYYIAMEYLVGEPLSRLCGRVSRQVDQRRHPMLPLRMADIIADACEGLHAAHELKDANGDLLHVVHRDVSPRNLFVTYDGSVQVVDFGIASARQRLHHTATGQVKGTFAYMAPEQLTSSPIDRKVDIWSLGVTLWEMLTLRRLFRRDTTANTIHAVLYDDIEPPSKYRSQVPKELDEIVLRALERDPEDRWQTAREMGRAIRQFLGNRDEVVGPAELSDWMREIFPQGEARKSQLMEVARLPREPVPAMPQAGTHEATMTATEAQLTEAGQPPERGRRAKRFRLGAFVVGALLLVGLGAVVSSRDSDRDVDLQSDTMALAPTLPSAAIPRDAPAQDVPEEVASTRGEPTPEAAPQPEPEPEPEKAASSEPEPTRKARTARRAHEGPGAINLVTRGGWADVYRANKRLGATPLRITLPSGRQRLVLKPFGDGKPKRVWIHVQAGKTRNVSIPLE